VTSTTVNNNREFNLARRDSSPQSRCGNSGNIIDNKSTTRRLRMTFRMKRSSNILDEVIESGERQHSSDVVNSSIIFEPHYEILRCEASSPTLSNNNSPIRSSILSLDSDFHTTTTPKAKKSKKKSKKRKHKSKNKDKEEKKVVVEQGLTPTCTFQEEHNSKIIVDDGDIVVEGGDKNRDNGKSRVDDDDNNNEKTDKKCISFDLDCLEPESVAPLCPGLTVSPASRSSSSSSSSSASYVSTNPKTKRLKLVIGNEACTIIDIPPTAFQGPVI
jgi:hypothetical protein